MAGRRRCLESGLRGLRDRDDGVFSRDVDHVAERRREEGHRRLLPGSVGHLGREHDATMPRPDGLNGDAPFADSRNGILPNRWPQANVENATEKEPGAASVWQQKQKVHLLANTDRNLPALVVNFDEARPSCRKLAKERLTDLLPALVGKHNKIETAGPLDAPAAAEGQPVSRSLAALLRARASGDAVS